MSVFKMKLFVATFERGYTEMGNVGANTHDNRKKDKENRKLKSISGQSPTNASYW
jgi:hypothetical protein